MMQQALRLRHAVPFALPLGPALAVALAVTAAASSMTASPLHAQTSNTWVNTKISDLRRHQEQIPSEAAEHYETAQRYLVTIDRLDDRDELSKRQQKKLDRAYEKATRELRAAIEKAPDWVEARMALAALYYREEAFEDSRGQYQEVLRLEPDNERAKSFLGTVEYYISRQQAGEPTGDEQARDRTQRDENENGGGR